METMQTYYMRKKKKIKESLEMGERKIRKEKRNITCKIKQRLYMKYNPRTTSILSRTF